MTPTNEPTVTSTLTPIPTLLMTVTCPSLATRDEQNEGAEDEEGLLVEVDSLAFLHSLSSLK